ncbi:GL8D1 protein, partial [Polypterus senegalus]
MPSGPPVELRIEAKRRAIMKKASHPLCEALKLTTSSQQIIQQKLNIVILLLIAVAFLIIVHRNLLSLNDFLKRQISDVDQNGLQPIDFIVNIPEKFRAVRTGEEIPVVITAVEERLGGLIAAVNSIHSNTQANVVFYFVTTNDTVMHLKHWITQTDLKDVKYRIVPFDPHILAGKIRINSEQSEDIKPLTFARFFLPAFVPDGEKAIYMDDDVIVQGDIQELYNTKLKAGHAAAFSDDCDSASSKGMVRGAGNQKLGSEREDKLNNSRHPVKWNKNLLPQSDLKSPILEIKVALLVIQELDGLQ